MRKGERRCDFRLGRFGLSFGYVNPAKGDYEAVKKCSRIVSVTACVMPHMFGFVLPLRLRGWLRCEWASKSEFIWMFNFGPALWFWSNRERVMEKFDASTQSED